MLSQSLKSFTNRLKRKIQHSSRSIWIQTVQNENPFSNLANPNYTHEEASIIIQQHKINEIFTHTKLKFAAERLGLIDISAKERTLLRGEKFHNHMLIPDGIYELQKNTSTTTSLDIARFFKGQTQDDSKKAKQLLESSLGRHHLLYNSFLSQFKINKNLAELKEGNILTIIIPPFVPLIKIPSNGFEYVLPIGTVIKTESNGKTIHVFNDE